MGRSLRSTAASSLVWLMQPCLWRRWGGLQSNTSRDHSWGGAPARGLGQIAGTSAAVRSRVLSASWCKPIDTAVRSLGITSPHPLPGSTRPAAARQQVADPTGDLAGGGTTDNGDARTTSMPATTEGRSDAIWSTAKEHQAAHPGQAGCTTRAHPKKRTARSP
jgi:hypothetical protein